MPNNEIKRLVSSEGKTRTYEMEDGSVVQRSDGSVSWRNNNPGNLKFEFAGSADRTVQNPRTREQALSAAQGRYDGVVALDQWGNAIFETYEAGRAAKIQLLERRYADLTVEQFLPRYSRNDYSGTTNHAAQARAIYAEGDRQGFDLRGKTVCQMSIREREALADGIRMFEGWKVGESTVVSPPVRAAMQDPAPIEPRPSSRREPERTESVGGAAIYDAARQHFFNEGRRYEYGRPDAPRPGRDSSRLERDADGDGRFGVDCSSFLWRGLRNAGFDVRGDNAAAFTTYSLFNGTRLTPFARENFEAISPADARRPNGSLERGDILMFATANGSQHVGIFKGYDERGRIQFIGSQGSTGPAEVTVTPGGYWDGGTTRIVGALRARPEFQVRAPTYADESTRVTLPSREREPAPSTAMADGVLRQRDRGPEVVALQETLNRLGYTGRDGRPLETRSGVFGPETHHAVEQFQRRHGLADVDGIVGRDTSAALRVAATRPLLSEATHPNHLLYAEIARQLPPGTRPEAVANVTLQAMENGITAPDRLSRVDVRGSDVFVMGNVPGERVKVDLQAPTPTLQQMSDHTREQAQQASRAREQADAQVRETPVRAAMA